jgi:serine/threonine-protein kinase
VNEASAALLFELRTARGTALERDALERTLALKHRRQASEALLIEAAELCVLRGESASALALLDGTASPPALVLASDVRAQRGDLQAALALLERALAVSIDWPGARERHRALRERLGPTRTAPLQADHVTLLRADLPQASLRVLREVARGGAGSVYEAYDDALDRRVALKAYHRPRDDRAKLEREARVAAALAGPGIIRVFDADPTQGQLVMQWAPYGALKDWIVRREGRWLSPIERWFLPLVESVARVHERGIVHGDLKPANVLFRSPSEPLLSDFGLARRAGEPLGAGSLGYLSPERVNEDRASTDDDVYALGRILQDALHAVTAAALDEHWRAIATRATAPRGERPGRSAELLELCRSPQTATRVAR